MNSRVPVPRVLPEASETFFMFRRRVAASPISADLEMS
jgi:hypothetical protein|tara:strand:+ start:124 stop:237 length:114 start_codon:yes stop_codon:yes gene_type:complete